MSAVFPLALRTNNYINKFGGVAIRITYETFYLNVRIVSLDGYDKPHIGGFLRPWAVCSVFVIQTGYSTWYL